MLWVIHPSCQVERLVFTLDNIWKNKVLKDRALTKKLWLLTRLSWTVEKSLKVAHQTITDAFCVNSPSQCEDKRANKNSQLGWFRHNIGGEATEMILLQHQPITGVNQIHPFTTKIHLIHQSGEYSSNFSLKHEQPRLQAQTAQIYRTTPGWLGTRMQMQYG